MKLSQKGILIMQKWVRFGGIWLLMIMLWQGCAASKPQHDVKNIAGEYQKGLDFMAKKNWIKSEETFTFIVYNDPAGEYADDAQYSLAETWYFREEYLIAIDEYDRLIQRMPNSPLIPQASWRKAECYYLLSPDYRLDQTLSERALKELQNFVDIFPQDENRIQAAKYIVEIRSKLAHKLYGSGVLYLKLREWDSAKLYFDVVLENYYDTEYLENALMGKAEALVGENKADEAESLLAQINPGELDNDQKKQLARVNAELTKLRKQPTD
ncbi:MAG: hypothetical protein AUJ47_00150 [Candidatus Marinimicrobia bacterium CG1_02_48_14]|nr:MAG: hypothetical protein AUJ47_00150 [Candidatus Marinimicrobia bacterium CG1_02_48_14]